MAGFRDVRCPVSDHLLFRAAGPVGVVEIRCVCRRMVRIEGERSPRILESVGARELVAAG